MEKSEKFSDCVEELTTLWIMWLKNNRDAHDDSMNYNMRRKAGEKCELLIKRRHSLINKMNDFFGE